MSLTFSSRRPRTRFARVLAWFIAVLLVLCGVFLAIGYLQGPKLADAQIDTASAITQSQQLRLFFNQPITEVDVEQISVEPDAEFSVTTAGEVLAVQFTTALRYGADYTVTVSGVRGTSVPQLATVSHRFTTPNPTLFYLDRGAPTDQIIKTGLRGSEQDVVFRGERIQSFAVTGQVLAIVSLNPDDTSRLELLSLADQAVETIRLPSVGVVSDLVATEVGSVLGFTFTPSVRDQQDALGGRELLLLNLESGRDLTSVTGPGGEKMPVTDWLFIPGSTSLIVQSLEQTAFVVDSVPKSIPSPIGRFTELVTVSSDGETLIARDALGAVFVSLTDARSVRYEPAPVLGQPPSLGQLDRLPTGDVIEKAAIESSSGRFVVVVAVDEGVEGRVLYETPKLAGSIEDFVVSPNGQFVAIEVVPSVTNSVSDGYLQNPRATSITTVLVEIESGLIVRSFEGFHPIW